ncbi:MAG: flavodoxin domain-containing protein [Alphaproteobacteria bacterium]|jgi:sulfite reductase (NADPH) flavoprotein alpha-component|nr:flavodoxin domain-containing protein [Alphaproteobacteria bacterium]
MSIKILYGSETGNSINLADKAAANFKAAGKEAEVLDMGQVSFDSLKGYESVIVITSTFGDGEPPFNAATLHEELKSKNGEELKDLKFAVYALGQSFYPLFAQTGVDFDEYLENNGASRIKEVFKSDDDFEETFEPWLEEVKKSI